MNINIQGKGWSAQIIHDDEPLMPDALLNVYVETRGDDKELALCGAKWVLNHFAAGRMAFIRAAPEANTERDFCAEKVNHGGFVRFSYRPESGEWHYPDSSDRILFFQNLR